MNTAVFAGRAVLPAENGTGLEKVYIHFGGRAYRAEVKILKPLSPKHNEFLVKVLISGEVDVYWGDRFTLTRGKTGEPIGEGIILEPGAGPGKGKVSGPDDYYKRLLQDEESMILALAEKKGIHGLAENEIMEFSSLDREQILPLCLKLEEKSSIRILSFSPLILLHKTSFEFLSEKIVAFIRRYHQSHPGEIGASRSAIRKRFSLHPRLLSLVLRHLDSQGRVKTSEKFVLLQDHTIRFSDKEERIMQELESLCLKGEIRSLTLQDLQRRFNISPKRLDMMIAQLAEKLKVVQAKEGFLVHSEWLERLIQELRESPIKTLTVAEFKGRTGLSRKYAIPLLELLDQMGVTRRKGASREIL